MTLKIICLLLFISSFISITNGQGLESLSNNLKSYKSINYRIDLYEEVTPFFGTSFTKDNLHDKLQSFFSNNNIPATEITTVKCPYLLVTFEKPSWGHTDGYNSSGFSSYYNAYDYGITFNLIDIVDGKVVIVYRCKFLKNVINGTRGDEANALWGDVDAFFNKFSTDWKATH